ncbi:MAG TPA: hypothetical protein VJB16_06750 [archaeon]|nr:hypothetical protein [archaeon]
MLSFLFGWNAKVRRLRKRWDRLREKALRRHEPVRSQALTKLDTCASNLSTLEEQRLGRLDRARIAKDLEIALAEIKELLKLKDAEYAAEQQRSQQKS